MQIKQIRNENDYEAALQRIESLWGAPPGTAEGDELDALAKLAEAYERNLYPIDSPVRR